MGGRALTCEATMQTALESAGARKVATREIVFAGLASGGFGTQCCRSGNRRCDGARISGAEVAVPDGRTRRGTRAEVHGTT